MKKLIHNQILLFQRFFWVMISIALAMPIYLAQAGGLGPGQTPPTASGGIKNPLQSESITDLIKAIANVIFKIGVPVAAIFIILSGLKFVTSRGNPEELKKAKMMFMWTIIGTAVLLGAKIIAVAIQTTVEGF